MTNGSMIGFVRKDVQFHQPIKFNLETQFYKGIPLKLIVRKDYNYHQAKRYTLNGTNQNVWIPNCFLYPDGTIKPRVNLDWLFSQKQTVTKLCLAHYERWKEWKREW